MDTLSIELDEIRAEAAWIRRWRRNATNASLIEREGIEEALAAWRSRVAKWRHAHARKILRKDSEEARL